MPGRLDLLVCRDLDINGIDDDMITEVEDRLEPTSDDAVSTTAAEGAGTTKTYLHWRLWPGDSGGFTLKCAAFIHHDGHHDEPICFTLNVTCTNPPSLDVRSMLVDDEQFGALYGALPTAVINPSIEFFSDYCDGSSRFWYLKLIENWMVVARHLRDDASELARLRSRFEETYLLVEVGSGHGTDIARSKRPEGWYEPSLPMASILAFAVVPLADEAALLALFNSQSTPLNLLEQSGRLVHLPSVDCHVVNTSGLDSRTNRVAKLGEGQFYPTHYP